ncbi:MAG: hypothetical protein OES57_11395 [Acidimicrobiia bacterium]|nr:hypothetical protein [Acidimicrobiia bacterium]
MSARWGGATAIGRVVKAIDAADGLLEGMVGRLRDTGVLSVTGRESGAVVSIVPGTVRT